MGVLLYEAARMDEAEAASREAAEAGHTGAMNNLGLLLAEVGRTAEAEAVFDRAAAAGDGDARTRR
ncbi:hypothetical protein [Streptomyces sp. NPDC055886]